MPAPVASFFARYRWLMGCTGCGGCSGCCFPILVVLLVVAAAAAGPGVAGFWYGAIMGGVVDILKYFGVIK